MERQKKKDEEMEAIYGVKKKPVAAGVSKLPPLQ